MYVSNVFMVTRVYVCIYLHTHTHICIDARTFAHTYGILTEFIYTHLFTYVTISLEMHIGGRFGWIVSPIGYHEDNSQRVPWD